VVRIDIAVNGDDNDRFSRWDGAAWQTMTTEDYLVPYTEVGHGPHNVNDRGFSWLTVDTTNRLGYYIIQDEGQFDNGEGDAPFLYPVLHHANEGDTDLYVFASGCCHDDHQQGPHLYLNGENIDSQNIVLWYVPQADTDATAPDYYCWTVTGEPTPETYPCYMGPMFVPTIAVTPTAGFAYNGLITLGNTSMFTNTSIGALTYSWNFGDGSSVSNLEHPSHEYVAEGEYTVTLTATNGIGSDIYAQVVQVGIAPTAVFTHPVTAPAQSPVQFTNQSTGTPALAYVWDFGDGSAISAEENPAHVIANPGSYTVSLSVSSPFGSDNVNSMITIGNGGPITPTAAFTATTTAVVSQPITFTNLTTGTQPISYTWDFGDGTPIVTEISPTHTFTATGIFTVTLTAVNEAGSSSAMLTIEVVADPTFNYAIYLPAIMREE
jgi:PKD repeat protein